MSFVNPSPQDDDEMSFSGISTVPSLPLLVQATETGLTAGVAAGQVPGIGRLRLETHISVQPRGKKTSVNSCAARRTFYTSTLENCGIRLSAQDLRLERAVRGAPFFERVFE